MDGRVTASRAAILAMALLAACASDVEVSATFDPLARFPSEATWSWDDRASVMSGDPRIATPEVAERLKIIAGEEFARRGYRESRGPDAPYRLSYELGFHSRISPDGSFAIGSLSLHLREAASRRRVWVGFARAEVEPGTDDPRSERLREALREMLEEFPPE